jgi:SAM-dependent methyltransferase
MVPLKYWLMRTLRRNTPQWMVDGMLSRSFYLKPGRDTSDPQESVAAYAESLARCGQSLTGKTVCVVGAGGGWAIGVYLLEAGAGKVILQDPFAPERVWHTHRGLSEELLHKYLVQRGERWQPRTEQLQLERTHLEEYAARFPASIDVICSNSVLEHVTKVESLVSAMSALLKPTGQTVHFVDLRDHYFRYPFEMLSYTRGTWERWLNASNTLNRLRRGEYEEIFRRHFPHVEIATISALPDEFARAKPRIRSEFLTGDDSYDATAIIRIEASLA